MSLEVVARLSTLGAVLAERMPVVFEAAIGILESIVPLVGAAPPARYEIGPPIGAGGMAEVFLGTLHGAYGFRREVALKRVRADRAGDIHAVTMLAEEALTAARCFHPNVVSVLDLSRDPDGRLFLVMEHVDGVDLARLVETGPVPHAVAIFIVRELLAALGYIHELRGPEGVRGLVHCDIKPRNVLLSWVGEVKLADFGLARVLEGTNGVAVDAPAGTPGHMSPEQAHGDDLDGRSDLYAVGIVLWELLAHERLRAGLPGDVRAATVFPAVGRPSEHRPGIPADLEAVAMELLAFYPEERYPTAEAAAHDLMRCAAAPRDGRGALVRLLGDRFPRSRDWRPLSRPPEPNQPTKTGSYARPGVAQAPGPWGREQPPAITLDRWRALALLLGLVMATVVIILLMAR